MQGKVAILESMVSVHCTTLHVIMMRPSCFNTNFASQMKLTKLPFIHCCSNLLTWGQALVPLLPSTYKDSPPPTSLGMFNLVQLYFTIQHPPTPSISEWATSWDYRFLSGCFRRCQERYWLYSVCMWPFWDFFNKEPWSFGEKNCSSNFTIII